MGSKECEIISVHRPTDLENHVTRRRFVAGAGLFFAASLIGGSLELYKKRTEQQPNVPYPFIKAIDYADGSKGYELSEKPRIFLAEFTAPKNGKIPIRHTPEVGLGEPELLYPYQINARNVMLVAGGTFANLIVNDNIGYTNGRVHVAGLGDKNEHYGIWAVLLDSKGKLVDPRGNLIPKGKQASFIAATFVSKDNSQE